MFSCYKLLIWHREGGILCAIAASLILCAIYIFHGDSPRSRKQRKGQPIGIENPANYCFAGCILHGIAACDSFIDWIKSSSFLSNSAINLLHRDLERINGTSSLPVNLFPVTSLESLFRRHYIYVSPRHQEDAYEFFYMFLDKIEEELKLHSKYSLTDCLNLSSGDAQYSASIYNCVANHKLCLNIEKNKIIQTSPFRGLLMETIKCSQCTRKQCYKYDSFLSLSLPVSGFSTSLHDLLDAVIKDEIIQDSKCDSCHSVMSKKMAIAQFPQCLCIHLQRIVWDKKYGLLKKETHVEFPEILVMDSCSGFLSKKHLFKQLKNSTVAESSALINQMKPKFVYRLKAAVIHHGKASFGHFTVYRKGLQKYKNNWFYISDTTVSKTSISNLSIERVYILFYEKVI